MPLTLSERIALGRALTPAEMDANWQAIEAAVNGLEAALGVALNADGTLKNGAVYTPDNLANNIVSLDKMATGSESDAGRFLRYNPVTGVLQAWPVDKPTPYLRTDASAIELDGAQSNTELGSWSIADIPAGEISVVATVFLRRNGSTPTGGTLKVLLGATEIGSTNTHYLQEFTGGYFMPVTILGHIAEYAGGTATLKVVLETSEGSFDMTAGVADDARFGRKVLMTAGY